MLPASSQESAPESIALLPERNRELDQLDRLLAVQRDGLAVGLDLLAAPGPQIGVPKGWSVAKRMRQGLPVRPVLGFEQFTDGPVVFPGLRKLVGAGTHILEPRCAVDRHGAEDRIGHRNPFLAVIGDRMRGFVIAALRVADLLGDVADIDGAVGVELRPVVDRHQDVGAGFRLDRRTDPRLHAVAVDGFDLERDAERLLGLVGDLAAQQLVGNRHEVDEFEPMQGRSLRISRRPPGGQDRREPATPSGHRTRAGEP